MERLCELFNQFINEDLNGTMPNTEDINDFAGKTASCFEEYNAIVEILMDAIWKKVVTMKIVTTTVK